MTGLERIVFESAKPIEIEVSIEKDDYVLIECDTGHAQDWRNKLAKVMQMKNGQLDRIGDIASLEAELVSYCLFKVVRDEKTEVVKRVPVPLETVLKLKQSITKKLFPIARRISGLLPKTSPEELKETIAQLQEQLDIMLEMEEPSKN